MERLLVVSNRLPISVSRGAGGLEYQHSVGGLATGLSSFHQSGRSLWIGWPGIDAEELTTDERATITERLTAEGCQPVFLSEQDVDEFYYGFCNNTIWPLFHYFHLYAEYDNSLWAAYRKVNHAFCDVIMEHAKPEDTIWVHDYHFMLLPRLLRDRLPKARIGFFLHIPFPSSEIFRLLNWRRDIIEGLLGADLIGFHTYDYARHFLSSALRLFGYEHTLGRLTIDNRVVKVDAFPMGIDYNRFATGARDAEVQVEIERIRPEMGERKIILSVDRLDYTKGIPERLQAFDAFLDAYPEYKGKVTLVLVAAPSRTEVEQYRELKRQLDELVGNVNGRHGTIGWTPVWYMYRSLSFGPLRALYEIADVALVTPLRDGMNLIAKEYVASKTDGKGVLILSEVAGAVEELGEALIVNPNNRDGIVAAIKEALTMPEEQQVARTRMMQDRLQRYNVERWAYDFVESLELVHKSQREMVAKKMTPATASELVQGYSSGQKRLILLDYDGTLVPFAGRQEDAIPDQELLELLQGLCDDEKNTVVVISGRDRRTLYEWLGKLSLSLVAEHGVWIKSREKDWHTLMPLEQEWKAQIHPILEHYMDRTPGSVIEEKDYSLVWHYRRVEPEMAAVRTLELKDTLHEFTANLELEVLEGNKVLEIKNSGINKGRAALQWLSTDGWDFVLAVGDDWTDEDTFAVLPSTAYSIKVGLKPSRARYSVESYAEVRALLGKLVRQQAGD